MNFRGFQPFNNRRWSNCNVNNCNRGCCNNNNCNRCNNNNCNNTCCNTCAPCDDVNTRPCCNPVNCNVPFCNRPLCPSPYNEADYAIAAIDALLCQYIEVEKKADFNFNAALVKLSEAIDCMKQGLQCNKEGYVIWVQIEEWLKRYYQRFGVYCGCLERMECIRECVRKILLCERTSLEQAICACTSLEESRTLDAQLQELKIEFKECCIPKC